jgi:hypothetical protein
VSVSNQIIELIVKRTTNLPIEPSLETSIHFAGIIAEIGRQILRYIIMIMNAEAMINFTWFLALGRKNLIKLRRSPSERLIRQMKFAIFTSGAARISNELSIIYDRFP